RYRSPADKPAGHACARQECIGWARQKPVVDERSCHMSDKSRGSAGQKRAAKAKKRAQKNQGTMVSLADRSRRTAVDEYQRLIPIFHAWLLDSGISTGVEMAAAHIVGVGQAVDLLAQDTIRFSATAWRTSAIDHLLRAACGSPVLTVGNTDQQFPSAELDTTA